MRQCMQSTQPFRATLGTEAVFSKSIPSSDFHFVVDHVSGIEFLKNDCGR